MPEKNLFANKHKLNVLEEKKQHLPLLHAKKQRVAAENERRAKREAELANDKKRDQAYEDELRKLQLESMKLELQAKAARVQRENDFIEQELKERAAKTDVIQSEADANRNISTGSKDLLQSEGKAREKKASSWW